MSAAAYGIPLAVLTTSAFNTGLILEKRALSTMPTVNLGKVGHAVVGLLSNPAWLAGFALMLTGLACQVIVLTFEPISLVQPILASGVTLTLVLSRLVLRERLGGAEPFCVTVLVVSLVLLALSQDSGKSAAAQNAGTGPMIAVVVPSLAIGLFIAAWRWRSRRMRAIAATGIGAGVGIGLLYGVGSLMTKGLSGVVSRDHTLTSLAFGILASPYLYLLFGCSAAALLLYQAALQACRASILIPVTNVVSSVYFLVAGTWLFHEHLPASPVKLGLRLAGIAAAGLVLVALSRQPAEPRPETARPETARPETARPDPALPDTTEPESCRPAAEPPWVPAEPPWDPAEPPSDISRTGGGRG